MVRDIGGGEGGGWREWEEKEEGWEEAICRLRPLDAVLSSGLCGKDGALPPVTG